jgi:exodeoxyribonuclease V alpha subunit
LAYAITIHKSQGSEYDKIIMPIIKEFSCMLNRNLLYTAFSRARYEILFCGEKSVLSEALHKTQSGRASGIVEKVFRGEHPTQM